MSGTSMNLYGRQLSPEEIEAGMHRDFVGGLWDEIGQLQLSFLVAMGLKPSHTFVDVGCGALRGGVHFLRYLETGKYHGIDINPSLIEAGRHELVVAGLQSKAANLIADGEFSIARFGVFFDFGIAVSVFTHLPFNSIVRCLRRVADSLAPGGVFFASYFPAHLPCHLSPLLHEPSGVRTYFDQDPFHQSVAEFQWMADVSGLSLEVIGDWGHPRGQQMLAFRLPRAP